MAQFGNKVKLTVLKGMEAIGQGASNLASNAQQRLQELNLDNQRRELLNAFPLKAYELWQKGESLPQPLEEMLKELKDVDERLNLIRAQRFAKLEEKKQQNAEPSPRRRFGRRSRHGRNRGGKRKRSSFCRRNGRRVRRSAGRRRDRRQRIITA